MANAWCCVEMNQNLFTNFGKDGWILIHFQWVVITFNDDLQVKIGNTVMANAWSNVEINLDLFTNFVDVNFYSSSTYHYGPLESFILSTFYCNQDYHQHHSFHACNHDHWHCSIHVSIHEHDDDHWLWSLFVPSFFPCCTDKE